MLMFKFEKDTTLKSEAAAGLKQQTFLNCRQHVLLVLWCAHYVCVHVHVQMHARARAQLHVYW